MANSNLVGLLTGGTLPLFIKKALKSEFTYNDEVPEVTYNSNEGFWEVSRPNGRNVEYEVVDSDDMEDILEEYIRDSISYSWDEWLDADTLWDELSEDYYDYEFDECCEEDARNEWDDFDDDEIQQLMEEHGYDDEDECKEDWVEERKNSLMDCYSNSVEWMKDIDPDEIYNVVRNHWDSDDLFDIWNRYNYVNDYADSYGFYYLDSFKGMDYYYREY